MSSFYSSNICLPKPEEKPDPQNDKIKDPPAPPWGPQCRSSTDILIKPSESLVRRQVFAALIACWANLASGVSLGYVTPALPKLQENASLIQITEDEGSWIASLVMLGALAGGLLGGPCISYGRRIALWLSAIPLALSWILVIVAYNTWFLYISHVVMGVCIGIISDAAQIYVSEIAARTWRGALGCIPILMFNVGILSCYIAGAWFTWQTLAMFGLGITLPAVFLPYFLPESPSFLVAKERTKDAIKALQWLRGPNFDITVEYQELLNCEKGPNLKERIKGICEEDMRRPLIITTSIRALSRFCGIRAILCYTQSIFKTSQSIIDAERTTIAIGAVQLIATLTACGLLDRFGRRKLLISSQIVMGLSLLFLGGFLYHSAEVDSELTSFIGWFPVVAILLYIIANSIGLGPVSGIIIGELVPQRQRSIVSSITGSLSWLSAFIVTKTFFDLRSCLHLHGAIWLYGIVCIFGAFLTYFLVPETRGLTQYEIEVLFKPKGTDNGESTERQDLTEVKAQNPVMCNGLMLKSGEITLAMEGRTAM